MAKGKTQGKKTNRPSTSYIIFVAISVILILSYILTLFVKF
jgi:hypothetical protein